MKTKIGKAIFYTYTILVLFSVIMVFGEIVRGFKSPWIWEEYPIVAGRHGTVDAVLTAIIYVFFYNFGFLAPYLCLHLVTTVLFRSSTEQEKKIDFGAVWASNFFISVACMMTFVFMLRSIVAFMRLMPVDVWNGWLMIFWIIGAGFCLLAGGLGLRREWSKRCVRLQYDAEVHCECPECGHAYTLPVEDLQVITHRSNNW